MTWRLFKPIHYDPSSRLNPYHVIVSLLKIWRKVERGFKRLYRPSVMRELENLNHHSDQSILDPAGPVVSLTTFGKRIDSVFYTIESIARGQQLPSRLTLWLNHEEYDSELPNSLKRLQYRGLDIRACTDRGPHKKYLPEVQAYPDLDVPFVTADDDTLYPRYWLNNFKMAYEKDSSNIYCYRAHRIGLTTNSHFAPYKSWQKCLSKRPSHLNFSTGDCGVLFPPKMRQILHSAGEGFLELCPKADDIWLNYHALKFNIPVSQIVRVPKRFYEVPGTRDGALSAFNNGQGGNDKQLSNTYSLTDRQRLAAIQRDEGIE